MSAEAGPDSRVCPHLGQVRDVVPQSQGCQECLLSGDAWVHLRLCLTCGNVGCCDDSRNRHATAHFAESGHPVIRSFEPGEMWAWCYFDRLGSLQSAAEVDRDVLRRVPLFAEISEEDLDHLYQLAETLLVPGGQLVMQEGEVGDALYVVLDGEVEVTRRQAGEDLLLGLRGVGEFIGERSLLKAAPRSATVRALRDTRLLVLRRTGFQTLISCSPSVPAVMLETVMSRLESTEKLLAQKGKMAALGTMAAGLAHELNNPAAAIQRAAAHVQQALDEWESATVALTRLDLEESQRAALETLRAEWLRRAAAPARLGAVERNEREEDLESWLEENGVPEAWDMAATLVESGWDQDSLRAALEPFARSQVPTAVQWLAAMAGTHSLLNEVQLGANAIAEMVKAVKTYSYLDQAPVQRLDLHEGLESTLVIMRHKLKEGVEVVKELDPSLPRIEAFGSELNQVWTNLIDNAIQAMNGQGTLTIRTRPIRERDRESVEVEVCDTGPGIPPEVEARLFEPFYTTKAQGEGTGLGLHIVYNTVVERHRGQIAVESRPGSTCFRVTLPVHLARDPELAARKP